MNYLKEFLMKNPNNNYWDQVAFLSACVYVLLVPVKNRVVLSRTNGFAFFAIPNIFSIYFSLFNFALSISDIYITSTFP